MTATEVGIAAPAAVPVTGRGRGGAVLGLAAALLGVTALVHLGQGSSDIGIRDILALPFGSAPDRTGDILWGSRLPRTLAGLVAGAGLGLSGALAQSVTRNRLAAPDTLGVNGGAYAAVVAVAVLGFDPGVLALGGAAFVGGVLAALVVHLLAAGGPAAPGRVLLAGTAVGIALMSLATLLLILDEEQAQGLFFWGNGSLVQVGMDRPAQMGCVVALAGAAALMLSRPLDVLALGDDTARALGSRVAAVRWGGLLLAVLLASAAVAAAGPLAFVGLAAPAVVHWTGLRRHHLFLPAAALAGALLLLAADTIARALLPGGVSGEIPAGVVTALLGGPVLIALARRAATGQGEDSAAAHVPSRLTPYPLALLGSVLVLVAAFAAGLRLGDIPIGWSDLASYALGSADHTTTLVVEHRAPRLIVAAAAGACLAGSGVLAQAVLRNPLAEPGLLGVTGGASLGAVTLLLAVPSAPGWGIPAAAMAGGIGALSLVVLLAGRWRQIEPRSVVLVGVGAAAVTAAVVHMLALRSHMALSSALVWMSGSTYARGFDDLVWLAVPLAVLPVLWLCARPLDLLALGDDLPRSVGLALTRTRVLALGAAALLAAGAAAAVGTVAFVGLVAPHIARALVGPAHRRLLPVAVVLGAALLVAADTFGRWLLAPTEIPSGLVTAMIGTPYLVWLLRRRRSVLR